MKEAFAHCGAMFILIIGHVAMNFINVHQQIDYFRWGIYSQMTRVKR
jgi:hypothetical protein